jgi:hypothetical protein
MQKISVKYTSGPGKKKGKEGGREGGRDGGRKEGREEGREEEREGGNKSVLAEICFHINYLLSFGMHYYLTGFDSWKKEIRKRL